MGTRGKTVGGVRGFEQFITKECCRASCWGAEGNRSVIGGDLQPHLALHGLLSRTKDSGNGHFVYGF